MYSKKLANDPSEVDMLIGFFLMNGACIGLFKICYKFIWY